MLYSNRFPFQTDYLPPDQRRSFAAHHYGLGEHPEKAARPLLYQQFLAALYSQNEWIKGRTLRGTVFHEQNGQKYNFP